MGICIMRVPKEKEKQQKGYLKKKKKKKTAENFPNLGKDIDIQVQEA